MLTRPGSLDRNDAIARLRAFISAGGYRRGDRLPPERELIGELGISRSTLRKALEALERNGAIWRHVGKGTFLIDMSAGPNGAGLPAQLARELTPVRMMRARLCIEPALAREAAVNASGAAVIRMRQAMERARAAPSWRDYEAQDDLFHRSVAEGADNPLLLALFDQLNAVRRAVAWGSVTRSNARPPADHSSFAEHEQVAAAIEARDPNAAYEAMRRHLGSVSARLFDGP